MSKARKAKNTLSIHRAVAKAYTLAKAVRRHSHAPYSRFRVGAALVTTRGRIFSGCNVENASYGGTVCAERVAILKAVSEGQTQFSDVIVVTDAKKPAFPCALCLQTMAEFFSPSTRIWVADLKAIRSTHLFSELLPHRFGQRELKLANK